MVPKSKWTQKVKEKTSKQGLLMLFTKEKESEEKLIVDKVNMVPKPKWTQLSNRRLQNWGGIPHSKGMISEPIPQWIQEFMDRVDQLKSFGDTLRPNHVLINEYHPGQGIMSHFDGPLFHPTVATISCGSHTVLSFKKPGDNSTSVGEDKPIAILLERRSLLLLKDSMYHDYQHCIEDLHKDVLSDSIVNFENTSQQYSVGDVLERSTRISLTIRHVPKTTKLKINLAR